MKFFTVTLIFFVSFQVSGQKINKWDLLKCWTDSREENIQGANVSIYRPCDYKDFPISRFRFKMNLQSNSVCSWLVLSPDDGHFMQDGTWTFNEKNNELILNDMKGKQVFRFIIIAVENNILKIKN